jgi:hypothetical protein
MANCAHTKLAEVTGSPGRLCSVSRSDKRWRRLLRRQARLTAQRQAYERACLVERIIRAGTVVT